jgi:DNA polymerase-4
MEDKQIVHFDLDSFFVSVECRKDKRLLNRPVAIGGSSERGVVASCSYEARKYGVHSAMNGKQAKRLCPELIFVKPNFESYSKASHEVTQIIAQQVPVFEKSSIDEFYIDMTGMDKYFGTLKLVKDLRNKIISETQLPISCGLSANKTVSKIATGLAKPNNFLHVMKGTEKAFLSPLPVGKIPMIGQKAVLQLKNMGIVTISDIQQKPLNDLETNFGKQGLIMWENANGTYYTEVIPYSDRKSISSETTFEKDINDIKFLKSVIISLTEALCSKIRSDNFLTTCVTLKIRYGNFSTYTHQTKVSPTSADHILIAQVKDIFNKIYNQQTPIRLIGVKFSNLIQGHYQINIFEDSVAQSQLYQTLDMLNHKYGKKTVCRAISMRLD